MGVDKFAVEVEFRFEADSVEDAGAELRRLQEAALSVGFELTRGKIVPATSPELENSQLNGFRPEVR